MPFEKGKSKTGGRKKGVENKATKQRKEIIGEILTAEQDYIPAVLKKLRSKSPMAYMNAILGLLEYDTPKLSRSEIKAQVSEITVVSPEDE